MTEGDELLQMIREIVAFHGVPPAQRAVVSDVAARVVVMVLQQPHFYQNLKVVLDLRQQNDLLRQQLAHVSALVYREGLKRQPVKKRPPVKKAVGTRAPKVTVKSATKAFKKGASGR